MTSSIAASGRPFSFKGSFDKTFLFGIAVTVAVIDTPASLKPCSLKAPVATVTTSRVISSCILHFVGSMRVGESVGFILDLISLIIGLGIDNNIVFVVFSTIWIIRIVLSSAKQGRSILWSTGDQ